MDSAQATRHLEVIRTLMERAAVYRRALAPTSLVAGGIGAVAALLGFFLGLGTPRAFGLFWAVAALVAGAGALFVMRAQAIRAGEPFWSPPTRRVAQAFFPPLFVGLVGNLVLVLPEYRDPLQAWWAPPLWMVLYGCALHAAGFFMPRGIRLLGWVFILSGSVLLFVINARSYAAGMPDLRWASVLMGLSFGGVHLAYAAYLYATGQRKNEA